MTNYIALDVGGTSITAAVVTSDGNFIVSPHKFSAYSNSDKTTIINNLADIINQMIEAALKLNLNLNGIGIGFPGPFDYENGISLIQNINKFDSIYQVNLTEELVKLLRLPLQIRYANDADLYCLGECTFGVGQNHKRIMCICIGTGIGSGFFADGHLVKSGANVPASGWIYPTPYRDGIADEYLSATGIRKMMKRYPETAILSDVKELSQTARINMPRAREIFGEVGRILNDIVTPYVLDFQAECLIVGGDVARSFDLFSKPVTSNLRKHGIKVLSSRNFSNNTLLAASLLFT